MHNLSSLPLPKLVFLILHIIGGITSLLVGIIPMVAQKGSKLHKRAGWVFTAAMVVVFITSLALSTALPLIYGTGINLFLLFIGVFSIYFVFTGLRGLRFHRPGKPHGASFIDYAAALLLLLLSLALVVFSFINPYDFKVDFNIVFLIFSLFGINLARVEAKRFHTPYHAETHKHQYFFHHITNMCSAYISAATAFVVVNINFLPPVIVWVGPGLIGGIFVSRLVKHYKNKFELADSNKTNSTTA